MCLAFVLVYFVWYPRRVAARTGAIAAPPELFPDRSEVPALDRIRNVGDLFADLFFFLNRSWSTLIPAAGIAALVFCTPLIILGLKGEALFLQKNALFGSVQSLAFFCVSHAPIGGLCSFCIHGHLFWILSRKTSGVARTNCVLAE